MAPYKTADGLFRSLMEDVALTSPTGWSNAVAAGATHPGHRRTRGKGTNRPVLEVPPASSDRERGTGRRTNRPRLRPILERTRDIEARFAAHRTTDTAPARTGEQPLPKRPHPEFFET